MHCPIQKSIHTPAAVLAFLRNHLDCIWAITLSAQVNLTHNTVHVICHKIYMTPKYKIYTLSYTKECTYPSCSPSVSRNHLDCIWAITLSAQVNLTHNTVHVICHKIYMTPKYKIYTLSYTKECTYPSCSPSVSKKLPRLHPGHHTLSTGEPDT